MTLASDTPKDSFRLSMLIYDTRYRSYTIQFIVLGLVMLFFMWLVNNTITNLADRGKDIGFGFLWSRAGYDIDQQLIPYTNDSTHFRALLIVFVMQGIYGAHELEVAGIEFAIFRVGDAGEAEQAGASDQGETANTRRLGGGAWSAHGDVG